jgi:hypothetical protein
LADAVNTDASPIRAIDLAGVASAAAMDRAFQRQS